MRVETPGRIWPARAVDARIAALEALATDLMGLVGAAPCRRFGRPTLSVSYLSSTPQHVQSFRKWHRRFSSAGLSVSSIEDMPWGMHEFTLTDPSGNTVRVGRNVAGMDEG